MFQHKSAVKALSTLLLCLSLYRTGLSTTSCPNRYSNSTVFPDPFHLAPSVHPSPTTAKPSADVLFVQRTQPPGEKSDRVLTSEEMTAAPANSRRLDLLFGNCDAYLFDWDGLIVNTQELLWRAWKESYEKEVLCGEKAPLSFAEWSLLHHSSSRHNNSDTDGHHRQHLHHPEEQLLDWRTRQRISEGSHKLYRKYLNQTDGDGGVRILQGVEEFLAALNPHRVYVVTSSSYAEVMLIRKKLHNAVLEAIPMSHWLTRETYQHRKPNPDGWNRAIEMACQAKAAQGQREKGHTNDDDDDEQHVVPVMRIVGFEDTPSGIRSLLAAAGPIPCTKCVLVSPFPYDARAEWNDDPRVMRLEHF